MQNNQLEVSGKNELPVAVIGAGPIGLAAAAHLVKRGLTPLVLESGGSVGASVLKWAHVKMFSPWEFNVDKAASELLTNSGWQIPDAETMPTGRELFENYLKPFANLSQIKPHVYLNSRVVSVTRQNFDKMKTVGRDDAPFVLHVENNIGEERQILVRAVIDASGTYEMPNPAGANGVFATGEKSISRKVFYGVPNVKNVDRERYAGKRIAVIGSGHSAFNVLLDLATLAESEPDTQITWIVRRANTRTLFGGGELDQLPARGLLGSRARKFIESGVVKLVSGFNVAEFESTNNGIVIKSDNQVLSFFDEVIVATGFRPDLAMLRELRLNLDEIVESPKVLADLIDPNLHSCGTVYPHGAEELKHPETDFYIAGMKSYGRAPTFLMMTGYEQVRSIVAAIAGDWDSARKVELVLPETGVCKTDESGESCCGGGVSEFPEIVQLKPFIRAKKVEAVSVESNDADCCGTDCCTTEVIATKPIIKDLSVDASCCDTDCCGTEETSNFVSVASISGLRSCK